MNFFKSSVAYVVSAGLVLVPLTSMPARAGGGDALFGAMAGMAVGAMIAGSARGGGYHRYQARRRVASHHVAKKHAAPSETTTVNAKDPFAGAPQTTPARYQ
jgi:hypothetical protein